MNFFETYKSENPDFGTDTFKCASETVTKLLQTATSSDHPGMLLGKVQSGKTRTFISILADAFDSGFDIAIVLSKNSKALIEQTVKRLDSEFKTFTDSGECEVYDVMNAPDSFNRFELQAKHIFIAKKQTHNLQRLIDLFHTKCPEMANMRTLIIDDEADNASVGYANKKGSIESTKKARLVFRAEGLFFIQFCLAGEQSQDLIELRFFFKEGFEDFPRRGWPGEQVTLFGCEANAPFTATRRNKLRGLAQFGDHASNFTDPVDAVFESLPFALGAAPMMSKESLFLVTNFIEVTFFGAQLLDASEI